MLIKFLNNKGNKYPPCWTPIVALNILDEISNKLTNYHLLVKYKYNH